MAEGANARGPAGSPRVPRAHLPALVVTIVIALVGPLFVASYSLAMGDPVPRAVPVAAVGRAADEALANGLDASGDEYRVEEFASASTALHALDQQQVYAVLDADASPARLTISTASGASIARSVELRQDRIESLLGAKLELVDRHPLPERDPQGLVLFYLALGATILGFIGAIQTRINSTDMSLRAILGWDVVRSLVVAGSMTVVIGPVLGLESFPVAPAWLLLGTTMFVSAMVYSFWRVAIGGRWALLPTWITFVVIANPSSGGAVAPQLLPPFYEFVGRWLPSGATVRVLRDITYFPDEVHPEALVVLAVWLVVSTAAFIVAREVRSRRERALIIRPTAAVAVDGGVEGRAT